MQSTRLPKLELPGASHTSSGFPGFAWLGKVRTPGLGRMATAGLLLGAVVFAGAARQGETDLLPGAPTTESL